MHTLHSPAVTRLTSVEPFNSPEKGVFVVKFMSEIATGSTRL